MKKNNFNWELDDYEKDIEFNNYPKNYKRYIATFKNPTGTMLWHYWIEGVNKKYVQVAIIRTEENNFSDDGMVIGYQVFPTFIVAQNNCFVPPYLEQVENNKEIWEMCKRQLGWTTKGE